MNRGKGSEVPEMLPHFLPHNCLVVVGGRTVGGGEGKAVVDPCNYLSLTLYHLLQLQFVTGSLSILRNGVICYLRYVRVADVLDGAPPSARNVLPRNRGSEENKHQKNKALERFHGAHVTRNCSFSLLLFFPSKGL